MTQSLASSIQNDYALKMAVGFKDIDGKLWHFEKNGYSSGSRAWFETTRNGRKGWYYCVEEGVVATGFQDIGDERFYFSEKNDIANFTNGGARAEGELVSNSWIQINSGESIGWYRADNDGQLNRGLLPWRANDRYFFDKKSGKSLFSILQSGEKKYGYVDGKSTQLLVGFHADHEGNRYYFHGSGDGLTSLAIGELAQGWFHIQSGADAGWYYANNEGIINTGVLALEGNDRYFFDKTTGKSLFSIRTENGKKYGFGPGSSEVTSKLQGVYGDTHGNHYYFSVSGDGLSALAVSELAIGGPYTLNGRTYYFDVKSGKSLELRIFFRNKICSITRTSGEKLKGKQTLSILLHNADVDRSFPMEIDLENDRLASSNPFFDSQISNPDVLNVVKGIDYDSLYVEQLYGVVPATFDEQSEGYVPPRYYFDPKHPDNGVSEGQKAIDQDINVGGKLYRVKGGSIEGYDGPVKVNGLQCFFDKGSSIKKASYWYQHPDGRFFHYNKHLALDTGWIEDFRYYLGEKGRVAELAEGQLATNWRQIENKWYYFGDYDDGTRMALGDFAQGLEVIGGNTYFFSVKERFNTSTSTGGEMFSGWQDFGGAGIRYFAAPDDEYLDEGVMPDGFHTIKNRETNKDEVYYFATRDDADKNLGTKVVGWHKTQGDWYYFDARGVMMTGWLVLGDKIYYLGARDDNSDVSDGVMASGWHHIGDKKFYFGVTGDQTGLGEGQLASGKFAIAGKQYYFAENTETTTEVIKGEMATGWQQRGEAHFYYGSRMEVSSLEEGEMAQYFVFINEKCHYFSGDGSAYAYSGNSWLKNYNASGAPVTWYLLEKSELATGWHTIEGKKYYFGSPAKPVGLMQEDKADGSGLSVGEIATGFKEIEEELYYFAEGSEGLGLVRGECASRWFELGGETYYADPESGALNRSVLNISGLRYFFDKTGRSLFCIDDEAGGTGSGPGSDRNNKLINALAYDGNGTGYCFDAFAKLRHDWYTVTTPVKGRVYGGTPGDGTTLANYQLATGFQTIDGKLYHFNEKGLMSTGWFMVDGDWYRYDAPSEQLNRGVLKWEGNQYYHFDELTGKFRYMFMVGADGGHTAYHYDDKVNYKKFTQSGWTADKHYYLDSEMKVVTGWQQIDNKFYYFNPGSEDFGKIKTGFQVFDGKQYYLGAVGDGSGLNEGEMARYFVRINDRQHYFQGDGVAWPAKCWLSDYNKTPIVPVWYILDKGECAFGWESIDGRDYFFDPHNDCRLDS